MEKSEMKDQPWSEQLQPESWSLETAHVLRTCNATEIPVGAKIPQGNTEIKKVFTFSSCSW